MIQDARIVDVSGSVIDRCDNCNRTGLKRTIILVGFDRDGSERLVNYGTTCAARALSRQSGLPMDHAMLYIKRRLQKAGLDPVELQDD